MAAHAKAAKTLDMFFKNGMKGSVQKDDVMLYAARNLMTNLAKPLVQQMGIGSAPVTMLDNASGTGVMTDQAQVLLREGNALDGSRFVAADSSQMLMDLVMRRVEEEGWVNTETKVLDAMVCRSVCPFALVEDGGMILTWEQDTKLPDDTFSHVAIGLALHLTPRPDDVLKGKSR